MGSRVERIRLDPAKLPALAAEIIAAALVADVGARGSATLCLSGGSTPRQTYEWLARVPGVPWERIAIYFGDERCVPPDHADSNYAMAKAALFEPLGLVPSAVHRLRGELPDHDAAARDYERALPAAFDVLVLGVGEDAHTASLFPRSPALDERTRRVVHVVGDKPPPDRLSITPPVIEQARLIVVLATGASKAEAVRRALESDDDVRSCPVRLARDGVWLMDWEASGRLVGAWGSSATS